MTDSVQTATAGLALGLPEGKSRVLLQFNKLSGAFTTAISYVDPATLNNDHYVYVEAEYDFENDLVEGKYPDFKIIHRFEAKPKILERELEEALRQKITKRYPVIKQVNTLSHAITAVAEVVQRQLAEPDEKLAEAVEALLEMRDYIAEVRQAHDNRVAFYQQTDEVEFISNEDLDKVFEEQLEGGLHEVYGPREIKGGSVF